MPEPIYKWCCRTVGCNMMNVVEQEIIDGAIASNKKPLLICRTCGYVYKFAKKGTAKGPSWLECIPFYGAEARLPTGPNDDGTYQDYKGKGHWEKEKFTIEFGIDPKIYLEWRDSGKPVPKPQCED
jgi:hypothetical protein